MTRRSFNAVNSVMLGDCIGLMRGLEADSVDFIPVSYTHLDVYKRQVLLDQGDEAASSGTRIASAASRPDSTERLAPVSRGVFHPLAKRHPTAYAAELKPIGPAKIRIRQNTI